jgi:opacity protein-like surface antigen
VLVHAQQITVGAGLAYGAEVEQAGIILNGQYFFNDTWAAAPTLIFYFPDTDKFSGNGFNVESRSSAWEFNADVNYYFLTSGIAKFYGEGGLNVMGIKSSTKTTGNFNQKSTSSDSKVGLNLGVGVDFNVEGKIIPFVGLKYTLSEWDQLVLKGGIRILIN